MKEELEKLITTYRNYNNSTIESLKKDDEQNFLSEVERIRRSANVSVIEIVLEDLNRIMEKEQTK